MLLPYLSVKLLEFKSICNNTLKRVAEKLLLDVT